MYLVCPAFCRRERDSKALCKPFSSDHQPPRVRVQTPFSRSKLCEKAPRTSQRPYSLLMTKSQGKRNQDSGDLEDGWLPYRVIPGPLQPPLTKPDQTEGGLCRCERSEQHNALYEGRIIEPPQSIPIIHWGLLALSR